MYEAVRIAHAPGGADFYRELGQQMDGLLAGERNWMANFANCAALLFEQVPDLNWAGFYLLEEGSGDLVVGPFQGKPACARIARGRGVCGTALAEERAVLVPDVHEFPGHIACDSASRSELVIPLRREGRVFGVLDLDSPSAGRFSDGDLAGLEGLMVRLVAASDW